ncbi:MFS-type transporter ydgK [Mycobacteroides abscessus subsp. massiliense]|nr:MFS-type transporter ydgK [Mycobacteroides abscessus subsp. massiliense]
MRALSTEVTSAPGKTTADAPATDRTPAGSVSPPATRLGRAWLITVLGAMVALGPLTIDMYLPALPDIGSDLHVNSTLTQLTLTGTTRQAAAADRRGDPAHRGVTGHHHRPEHRGAGRVAGGRRDGRRGGHGGGDGRGARPLYR